MNPEILYPEIKEMKNDEIFIEWAYIVKDEVQKIHMKTIIKKQSYRAFVKVLEEKYNVGQEAIELVTISR
jgi:hypothetical protein